MNELKLSEIVADARNGSEQAYERLVRTYGPGLMGYFYRNTGRRSESEDLVQEVFLRVVKGLDRYREQERFEVWLYRIAGRLLIDYWRKSSNKSVSYDPEVDAAVPDMVSNRLSDRERDDALQQALAQLPAEQREVIVMRFFSGLSFQEISRANETPIGTALARAHRGLKKLGQLLGKQAAKGREE